MSEWASKPRTIHLAGRRKATSWFCNDCQVWHETHRSVNPEFCAAARAARVNPPQEFPHIRQIPKNARG